MFDISTEAMVAVLQSKLGKELDALWQEVMDYRDQSLQEVSFANKSRSIRKFFEKTTTPKLKDIVWRNVGLNFKDVRITSIFDGSFCTITFFDKTGTDKYEGTLQLEGILNADYIQKSWPELKNAGQPLTADDLIRIAESYDVKAGGIKATAKMEIRKIVNSILGFDVDFAFLMEDQLPANAGVANFTPREITSIVLHEIGHTLILVEHAGDCYARMSSFKYLTEAFRQANGQNVEESAKLAEKVAAVMAKKGDKTNAERLIAVTNKLKADMKTAGSSADPKEAKKLIGGFLTSVFDFIGDIFAISFDLIFGNQQGKRFGNDQKNKKSDLPINHRLVTWAERKADEYTFTHGYGADHVSAQNKNNKFFDRFGISEQQCQKLNEIERLHKGIGLFAKLKLLVFAPLYAGDYSYSLYPAGAKRFRELLNLTIQQLKANCTDSAYIAQYIKDCDYILSVCDNPNSRDQVIANIYRGYDIFMKYVSIPSFFDWIVHGRVKRELDELIEDANAVGNNLLTYYGFKIQQIGK